MENVFKENNLPKFFLYSHKMNINQNQTDVTNAKLSKMFNINLDSYGFGPISGSLVNLHFIQFNILFYEDK